jgi:hypothetical protein
MNYYFELRKSVNGQYFFRFRGPNHETIVVSETYTTKQNALHAINLLKVHGSTAQVRDNTAAVA